MNLKTSIKWLTLLLPALTVFAPRAVAQSELPLTVEQLFELTEQNNKTLKAQRTNIQVAERGIEAAKAQRLPDVSTSLSVSYLGDIFMTDRNFSNYKGYSSPHLGNTFALEASQVVYAGGAIDAGVRMAELQKEQAEAECVQTRAGRRFAVLGQYLDLCKIAHRMKVYEQNIKLTSQLIDDIKAKQQQGLALKNDITRYELQMQTLTLSLTQLSNQRSITNHQLCNALGLDTDVLIVPDDSIARLAYASDGENHWQALAAVGAPTLKTYDIRKRMARQQERLTRSEMLPKVAVMAADNFNGPITTMVPPINKNLNAWYVGVGVSYSISSLFKNNHSVKQSRLATRQSDELYAVAADAVNDAVQAAYTAYRQSYVELETEQKNVQLASQNYDVVNNRYLNQLALVTDMVDASNLKLRAELQEADARINIVYAYYKLCYLAGTI